MMRVLPEPDDATRPYWEAAKRGELAIQRCHACRTFVHPPRGECPRCQSTELAPEQVSGRGRIHTFTIGHHAASGIPTPFALVLVELEEQPGLRILANLLDCPLDQIAVGMRVAVTFEDVGSDVTLPQFKPH